MVNKSSKVDFKNVSVPINWSVKDFGEICSIRNKKFNPINSADQKYIALEHLEQGTGRILGSGQSSETTSIKSEFKKDDILFGKLRPYLKKYWLATFDGVCSTEILSIVPNDDIDNRFCFYLVQQEGFIEHSIRHSFGTKMPRTSWKEISDFQCFLPPLEEQRKIGAILTSIDDAIEKTEEIIKQTEVVKQGLMQRLLTKGIGHTKYKQTDIGEIPIEWELSSLGDISEIIMGQSPKGDTYNDEAVGSPLLNGPTEFGEVHPTPIQWTTRPTKFCEKNDILVCVRGSSTGRMNISDRSYCIGRGLAAIRAKNNVSVQEFLGIHVERLSSEILAQATGSTFPNIDKSRLSNLAIPLPPLVEQKKISNIIGSVTSKVQSESRKVDSLRQLKSSLMQVLLTGRVRVNVDEPSEVSV
ncbi:restriction endonuclease subunit S [Gottfriedia sp. NPDC056225]|uniref:restriction endonuclease subunit S n=1 Tax=Gottfriedia sp. NPDC056225 TaxID=3345751 RepID=UPI0035DC8C7C